MEPNPSAVSQILAYGTWSGPEYSNGFSFPKRRFTDIDRVEFGIDPYDNYVAKSHDLNEINAAENLRASLASLDIPDFDLLDEEAPDGNYALELDLRAALSDPPFRSC